jgi:zona occludens toxin
MGAYIVAGETGAGKTNYVMSKYVMPSVKEGRTVYTNIRGVCPYTMGALEKIDFLGIDQLIVELDHTDTNKVQHFYEWLPKNAVMVVDEAQNYFGSRSWNTRANKELIPFLTMNRHYGNDIVFITQDPSLIDAAIRTLANNTFYLSNLRLLGSPNKAKVRMYKGCDVSEENVLETVTYTHDKNAFEYYSSRVDGAEEQKVKKHIATNKKFVFIMVFALLTIGWSVNSVVKNGFTGNKNKVKQNVKNEKTIPVSKSGNSSDSTNKITYLNCISMGDQTIYKLVNGSDTIAPTGTFKKALQ